MAGDNPNSLKDSIMKSFCKGNNNIIKFEIESLYFRRYNIQSREPWNLELNVCDFENGNSLHL